MNRSTGNSRSASETVCATIIIVNWNGRSVLPRCLQALQRQTVPAFRAIVADNASSDGSAALVAQLGDDRFSLLQLATNEGFARANNLAVAQSDTPWIVLLNPDAFPAPQWLERLLAAAAEAPQVVAWGSTLIDERNPQRLDGTGDAYCLGGRAFRRQHGAPRAQLDRERAPVFSACAAAAMYRRSAWLEVGGFDESLFCYLEDVDLGFRLRLRGYECRQVADAECLHVGSATTGRHSDFSAYHSQRNLLWVYVKNMPGPLFWLLLPLHLATHAGAVVLLALRGQLALVLRAKRDALRALPAVWRQRKHIQATRAASSQGIWRLLTKHL